MSYDVTIGDFEANYTSNVSSMWYYSMGELGMSSIDGMPGRDAHAVLSNAFDKLRLEHFFINYEPPVNGWGSAEGGLIFMARIMAACARYPDEIVRVYS